MVVAYLNAAGWTGVIECLRGGIDISSVPERVIRNDRIQPCASGSRSSAGVPQGRSSEDDKVSSSPRKHTTEARLEHLDCTGLDAVCLSGRDFRWSITRDQSIHRPCPPPHSPLVDDADVYARSRECISTHEPRRAGPDDEDIDLALLRHEHHL